MKPNLRKIFLLAGIAAVILGAVWLTPRVLAVYYQIKGGNILERAQAIDSANNIDLMLCSNSSTDDRNILLMAGRSLSYLNKAEQLDPMASQTFLLMGRAYCLSGKIPESITSYKKFIKVRKENPVGHLELGFTFESQCEKTTNIATIFDTYFPENYCEGDQDLRDKILDEWKAAGVTARMFLDVGKEASEKKHYDEALHWYARAGLLSPDDGRIWYELGLAYEGMGNWQEALEVYNQGLHRNLVQGSGISSLYYRVGRLLQEHLGENDNTQARIAFEDALEKQEYYTGWEESDSHFRLGIILRQEGRDPNKYIKEFQSAIEIFPNHANAHLSLGLAYYYVYSELKLGEEEILTAIKIAPNNKWGYFQLAKIYRYEGMVSEAIDMYSKALEIDPDFESARKPLDDLLATQK